MASEIRFFYNTNHSLIGMGRRSPWIFISSAVGSKSSRDSEIMKSDGGAGTLKESPHREDMSDVLVAVDTAMEMSVRLDCER